MSPLLAATTAIAAVCAGSALHHRVARSSRAAPRESRPWHDPPLRLLRARRLDRAVDAHLGDAIELVVLAVRAGHLPLAAIGAVLPHMAPELRDAFGEVVRRTNQGERFAEALQALPQLLGPRAHGLADSFAAADRDGSPLAPVLDRLAAEARQQRRRRADTLARQLPVRLSVPLVLCTLPSFVLLAVAPLLLAAIASLRR